ncbi:unnamed protein product [Durusdinium trenchii]|uniref:Uncharacterized protein n=1 Tax=Durusdinium trenchii TaxID=1381693 RepID=A0ABP0NEN8_9DINO
MVYVSNKTLPDAHELCEMLNQQRLEDAGADGSCSNTSTLQADDLTRPSWVGRGVGIAPVAAEPSQQDVEMPVRPGPHAKHQVTKCFCSFVPKVQQAWKVKSYGYRL